MDEAITQAFYFYTLAVAAGTVLGVIAVVFYAGLYSLRSQND